MMSIELRRSRPGRRGFTLIEILVASSVAMAMMVLLASVLNHAGEAWSVNDRQSHLREQARQAAEMIRSDLQQARLSFQPNQTPGPRFVQNPTGLGVDYLQRDALFWEIGERGSASREDRLASVGYFVKRMGDRFALCRLYIPASDPDFPIYEEADWIPTMIDQFTPATAAENYRGLFLENTPGIWVRCFRLNNSGAEELYIPDSRTDLRLPHRVEISIAFITSRGMNRMNEAFSIEDMASLVESATDAEDFTQKLPVHLQNFSGYVTVRVPLGGRFSAP